MKTYLVALIAALMIASLCLTPAAAAPVSSQLAAVNCGDTYVVQHFDYLAKIASYCGTTVANILALNPQITNPNIIYVGQVLRLTGSAPVVTPPIYTGSGYGRVSLSAVRALVGGSVTVYVSGFPANAEIDYRVGKAGGAVSAVYDGTVGADGTTHTNITIPADANVGEYWVVQVITTSLAKIESVTSRSIYIGSTSGYISYTGSAKVSLSKVSAAVGSTVTVYVSGFPPFAEIDYRVGKKGAAFSTVYDGTVGSAGSTNEVITIPAGAVVGDYWVVEVVTTSLKNITSVTSYSIRIIE